MSAPPPLVAALSPFNETVEFLRRNDGQNVKRMLLEDQTLFRAIDDSGRLLIHWAASFGNVGFVELLLRAHPEQLDESDHMGWTPAMIAASAGHLDVLNFLVAQHADLSLTNQTRCTALHYAASKQHVKVMELVLKCEDLDVNGQDAYGNTALHRAASKDQRRAVQLLLATGKCQLNIVDCQGNTALHLACESQCDEVAADLVRAGAHLDKLNKDEKSALSLASPKLRAVLQRLAASG